MVYIKNPVTIIASDAGATDSSVKITAYNTTTGVITGKNFGTTTGTVYLLNRDTHSYTSISVTGWDDSTIVLTNPIDTSVIEGTTCFFVRTSTGANSNKFMITGDIAVTGWGIVYSKDPLTGNISKLPLSSSSDMAALVGSSSYNYFYGKNYTLGGVTIHTSQIVGVQFGTSVSYTIPAYFLCGLLNLDQPVVLRSGMTLNASSSYFMFNCRSFNCPLVLDAPSTQTRFGNYFMGRCCSFNQPIDLSSIKYWTQTYAFWKCLSFNNTLTLTTGLNASSRSFGGNLLTGCPAFNQPITIPSNCNQILAGFLQGATAFNQPITIPSGVAAVGNYFLGYCYAFNQPIDLSGCTSLTSVGNYFMYMCQAFNSPLKLPTSCTTLGTYFLAGLTGTATAVYTNNLYGVSFNQALDLSKVTTFGNYFMANQLAFNSPLDISGAVTIGTYFMQNCTSFAQHITIPSTVTSIGASFMINILTYRKMNVETATVPATTALTVADLGNNSTTRVDSTCPAVAKGVYLYGAKRAEWISGLPNSTSTPWRNLVNGGA